MFYFNIQIVENVTVHMLSHCASWLVLSLVFHLQTCTWCASGVGREIKQAFIIIAAKNSKRAFLDETWRVFTGHQRSINAGKERKKNAELPPCIMWILWKGCCKIEFYPHAFLVWQRLSVKIIPRHALGWWFRNSIFDAKYSVRFFWGWIFLVCMHG